MSSPQTISRPEYLALPKDEQKKWVLVTPTANDPELAASIDLMADQQKILEQLEPLQSKAVIIPNPLPGEQLTKLLDKIETMTKALDPIKSLTSVPIIGALAAPVVNQINQIFQMIGMILMMIMMTAKGTDLFTDGICEAVDQMDWDTLKERIDEMKKKYKEMKKKAQEATESSTETNDENDVKRKASDTASKMMNQIDSATQKQIADVKAASDACYNSVLAADAGARTVKILKETQLQQYSWKSMGNKIISVAGKLGIDMSPLNAPTQGDMEAFENMFPNPTSIAPTPIKRSAISMEAVAELRQTAFLVPT